LPRESLQLTVPDVGSSAAVTMTVFPWATPAAGIVTAIDVPVPVLPFVPTSLTREIAALAEPAHSAASTAVVTPTRQARRERAVFGIGFSTERMRLPPAGFLSVSVIIKLCGEARRFVRTAPREKRR
jgi:hypothetical protein